MGLGPGRGGRFEAVMERMHSLSAGSLLQRLVIPSCGIFKSPGWAGIKQSLGKS